METFKLSAQVTISIYTEVEAETLKEAISISEDRAIEQAQHYNVEQVNEVWTSDEYDGSPTEIIQY